MIEQMIYWSGVFTIMVVLVAITAFAIGIIFLATKNMIIKNLRSTYNHAQLYFFMAEVLKKGYSQAKDDIGKPDA